MEERVLVVSNYPHGLAGDRFSACPKTLAGPCRRPIERLKGGTVVQACGRANPKLRKTAPITASKSTRGRMYANYPSALDLKSQSRKMRFGILLRTRRGRSVSPHDSIDTRCFMKAQLQAVGLPRKIIGFHRAEQSDWIAVLECGHRKYVRYNHNSKGGRLESRMYRISFPTLTSVAIIRQSNDSKQEFARRKRPSHGVVTWITALKAQTSWAS
jgi:hypothetical protein